MKVSHRELQLIYEQRKESFPDSLGRLYTLRNQLLHGGATWQGGLNRRQVDEGSAMLGAFVPRFVLLMMNNPHLHQQWGAPPYPPHQQPNQR